MFQVAAAGHRPVRHIGCKQFVLRGKLILYVQPKTAREVPPMRETLGSAAVGRQADSEGSGVLREHAQ